jgi:hypothetical protein
MCKLTHQNGEWIVPSQTAADKRYTVNVGRSSCSCPDHQETGFKCKHQFAVEFTMRRELAADGTVTETKTMTFTEKKVYRQVWPAYNKAQTEEKHRFQVLLHDLCKSLPEPVRTGKRGRPTTRLADMVFSSTFKVYSTLSTRRFACDLKDAHEKGYTTKPIHYNSVCAYLESEELTPILKGLVSHSASPLVVRSNADLVRPNGSLKHYTIATFTTDLVPTGQIKYDGSGVDAIEFRCGDADNRVVLDQWNSPIAVLDGGGGEDTLSLVRDANMTVKDGELDINASPAVTVPFANFEVVSLTGGKGNNTLDASAFHGRVSLNGMEGNDKLIGTPNDDDLEDNLGNDTLIGNAGNDTLWGGDGNDQLDGGDGVDQLFEVPPLTSKSFTLTNTRLTGRGTDTLVSLESVDLRGRGNDDTFSVGAWTGSGPNLIEGNGGTDTLVATADANFLLDDPSVAGPGNFTLLRFITPGSSIQWDVRGTEAAVLTGGASANTFGLKNSATLPALTINGAGGNDSLFYQSATVDPSTVTLTNAKLTDTLNNVQVTLKSLEGAHFVTTNDVDVSGWTHAGKIESPDPQNVVPSVRSAANRNFVVGNTDQGIFLVRSDHAAFQLVDVALLDLEGGAGANILTVSWDGTPLPELQFDGGGGKDTIAIRSLSATDATFSELASPFTIEFANNTQPTDLSYRNVEVVKATGSADSDTFTLLGVDARPEGNVLAYSLDGGGGSDRLVFRSVTGLNLLLSNAALSLKDPAADKSARTVALKAITRADLDVSTVAHSLIDVTGWSHEAHLAFAAPGSLRWTVDANLVLTDIGLTATNGAIVFFTNGNPTNVELSDGQVNNQIDASSHSGNATLRGGAGNDTLIGGIGDDQIFGDAGNDWLDCGAGADLLDGGAGTDKHKNGETVRNCEAVWS